MDRDSQNIPDITRLYDSLGLDPAHYKTFEKRPVSISTAWAKDRRPQHAEQVEAPAPVKHARVAPIRVKGKSASSGSTRQSLLLEILSLGEGTGKTTLAGVLAHLLKSRGHSVLLVDESERGAMEAYFDVQHDGQTAMSFAPGHRLDAPLPILSRFRKGEAVGDFDSWYESVAPRANFILVDGRPDAKAGSQPLATGSTVVLVPVLPTMTSAMNAVITAGELRPDATRRLHFVLNRFDGGDPMHQRLAVWLRDYLGPQLLPFELPDDWAVNEIARGWARLSDVANGSPLRSSFELLVDWVEALGALGNHGRTETGR